MPHSQTMHEAQLKSSESKVSGAWYIALRELLIALKWRGEERQVFEALPHDLKRLDGDRFREIMGNLGFPSLHRRGSPKMLDARWLPALYLDRDGVPRLLIDGTDQAEAPDSEHALLLFPPSGGEGIDHQTAFVTKVFRRYRPTLVRVFWISLLITIVATAPSLFNRALYDNVIASGARSGMNMLLAGVLLALFCELALRAVRARNLSHLGARLDHFVSCTVFERLMALPPAFTERAAVSSQIARLRDFDSIREFCTGPLAPLIFELPLVLVYVGAMVYVGGWLALIPGVLVLLYVAGVMWVWRREQAPPMIGELAELDEHESDEAPGPGDDEATGRALLLVLAGLLGMVLGGALAVRGAEGLVDAFGVGESVVGLTVLALATSAEMVALVWAARRRGLTEVVVAGTVGAVAYNATVTLGLAALVNPLVLGRHNPVLTVAAVTAVLPLVLLLGRRSGQLPRPVGFALLVAYVAALGFLFAR